MDGSMGDIGLDWWKITLQARKVSLDGRSNGEGERPGRRISVCRKLTATRRLSGSACRRLSALPLRWFINDTRTHTLDLQFLAFFGLETSRG